MKDKIKFLVGMALMLVQTLSGAGTALATENSDALIMPRGSSGPEVYIKRIMPDEQKITMYHQDYGNRDRKQWLADLNVVWPKDSDFGGDGLDLMDTEPDWANTFFNGDAQTLLVSGWAHDVERQDGAMDLLENNSAKLYFSVKLRSYYPELDQKYWVDQVDYSDCMKLYQPGVVCEGQIEEDLTIKYYPYLDGVLLEAVPDNDIVSEEENTEPGMVTLPNETEFMEPVLLAGVGSAVIDSGSGGNVSSGGSIVSRTRNVATGVSAIGDDNLVEVEELDEDTDESVGVVAGVADDDTLEVPELGGTDGNIWFFVLAAFAVAALALIAWWWFILPLIKRKKDDENAKDSV